MEKWFVAVIVGLGALIGVAIAMLVQDSRERATEVKQLDSNCKVVGDAYDDAGDSGGGLRKMYQCPDGMFHIR